MDKRSAVRHEIRGQVRGRMVLAKDLELMDISMSGIRFKSLRRLDMNSQHRIRIGQGEAAVALKGVIVRATLKGLQEIEGKSTPVYEIGMHFQDISSREKACLENLISILCNE